VSGYGHPNANTKNEFVNFIWNLIALAKIEQKLAQSLNKSLTKIFCQKNLEIDNTPTNLIQLSRGALSPDTFTLNTQTQAFEWSFSENLHSHFKKILQKTNPGFFFPTPTLPPLPPNDSNQFEHIILDRPGLTLYIDKNYFGRLIGEIFYGLKSGALQKFDGQKFSGLLGKLGLAQADLISWVGDSLEQGMLVEFRTAVLGSGTKVLKMEAASSDLESVLNLQVKADLVLGKPIVQNALSGRMGKFFGCIFFNGKDRAEFWGPIEVPVESYDGSAALATVGDWGEPGTKHARKISADDFLKRVWRYDQGAFPGMSSFSSMEEINMRVRENRELFVEFWGRVYDFDAPANDNFVSFNVFGHLNNPNPNLSDQNHAVSNPNLSDQNHARHTEIDL
jgi:hypothetical protein